MAGDVRAHRPNKGGLDAGTRAWSERVRLNPWPLGCLVAIVVTGMLYSFYWNPLYHHSPGWNTPSDAWSTFRAAQYVSWGGEGQIYNNPAAFQTFPGIAVLLAPIAKLADRLRMTASFPLTLARPSAWILLGPAQLALGGFLLFPLDTLARRLSVGGRRRIQLLLVETVLIWPSVALWGHPEDALSLALGVYAIVAMSDGAWLRTAAFFGLALSIQPLIVVIFPMALAYFPARRWLTMVVVMALPSLTLFIAPLVQEWGPTTRILLKQPNFPIHNHPTPWMALSPVIRAGHSSVSHFAKYVTLANGRQHLTEVSSRVFFAPVVAAGPGRIVAVALAGLIGVVVLRKKPSLRQFVWFAALALALRCAFEPVMVPYYLLPCLVLVGVSAATERTTKRMVAGFGLGACTLLSYRYFSPWAYYLAMMSTLALVFFASWPTSTSRVGSERSSRGRGSATRLETLAVGWR